MEDVRLEQFQVLSAQLSALPDVQSYTPAQLSEMSNNGFYSHVGDFLKINNQQIIDQRNALIKMYVKTGDLMQLFDD